MTDKSLPTYQRRVAEFVARHHLEAGVAARLLDLLSELGELSKEALKASQYGTRESVQTDEWEAELGDVFFSLVCLANSTGVDLDTALSDTLSKYQHRLARDGDAGSGN